MREDYIVEGPTQKVSLEVEKEILEKLEMMAKHTSLTKSQLANTALKRFISQHKDFLPKKKIPAV